MSLQVWLPLNGNTNNQGLFEPTITNSNMKFSSVGKVTNGCAYFDGSTTKSYVKITDPISKSTKAFAISFWLKLNASGTYCIWNGRTTVGKSVSVFLISGKIRFDCSVLLTSSATLSTGTWYHIVCQLTESKNQVIFINGVQDTVSSNQSMTSDKVNVYGTIGRSSAGDTVSDSNYLDGYLNDFRIYDNALSLKEIKELSKGLCLHYKLSRGGENLLTNTLTTSPSSFKDFTSKASVSRLDGDRYTMSKIYAINVPSDTTTYSNYNLYVILPRDSSAVNKDGKTYTLTFKVKATKKLSEYSFYYEFNNKSVVVDVDTCWKTVTITGTATSQYSTLYVIYNQINRNKINGGTLYLADFKLELGSVATPWVPNKSDTEYTTLGYGSTEPDCSGYGNDGTISGTLTYSNDSPRYFGSSVTSETSQYITVPTRSYSGMTNSYTISCWLKKKDTTSYQMPWGFNDGNRLNPFLTSVICCNTGDSANNPFQNNNEGCTWSDFVGKWVMMTIVGNGSTVKMYINGEFYGQAKTYKGITGTQLKISGWDTGTSYKFIGGIVDFRIYATALSAEDVLALYNAPISIDNKGNAHCGELVE